MLEGENGVLLIERCGPVRTEAFFPNDTGFYHQWGLHNEGGDWIVPDADIDAPEAWEFETGSSNTIIAIIDLGVRADHEDLTPRVYGDPEYHYHGTHVAGIAAATGNNYSGGAGVNWHAMILNKVYDSTDHESLPPLIVSSVNMGADVINNSWSVDDDNLTIASAVAFAVKMDRVFVAAKGNDDSSDPLYPADYPFAFSVAASNHRDHRCDFSNYGNGVDVAAPGWGIFSTFASTPYAYGWDQGTSMAAPFVSGIASLLQAHRSDLCNDDILNLIRFSADDIDENPASPGYDDYTGWGRVNARQALDFLHPPYSLDQYTRIGGWVHHTDGPPLTWTFFDNPYIYNGDLPPKKRTG